MLHAGAFELAWRRLLRAQQIETQTLRAFRKLASARCAFRFAAFAGGAAARGRPYDCEAFAKRCAP
eukprot:6926779-Lingulodinium_polyedra.AAC.1